MAVNPYIKAGVALASAAVVAAVPVVAPPIAPTELHFAKQAQLDPRLMAIIQDPTVIENINAFFPNVDDPDAPYGLSENARLFLLAVIQQDQHDVLNGFFDGGFSEVVRQFLVNGNPDPAARDFVNGYFAGGATETVKQFLLASITDPDVRSNIEAFFPNIDDPDQPYGASEVVRNYLLSVVQEDQHDVINGFFDGGVSEVARQYLVNGNPDPLARATVNAYFDGGVTEVARQIAVVNTLPGSNERLASEAFFNDGVTGVARLYLLGVAQPQDRAAINAYFDGGITEVVRLALAGPRPPVEEEESLSLASASTLDESSSGQEAVSTPGVTEDVNAKKAPDVQPVSTPAVDNSASQTPSPQSDPGPTFTAKINEDKDEEEAGGLENGNLGMAKPEIIVGQNGRKPSSAGWGIFQPVADAVGAFLSGGQKPATSSATTTGATTTGATATGGSTTGGSTAGGASAGGGASTGGE